MSTPRTEAGRELLRDAGRTEGINVPALKLAILAIEEEATERSAGAAPLDVKRLERQVLDLGGRLKGFEHWRSASSAKPSDPDDVRWECSCGYAGSPETVQRHWAVHRDEYAAQRCSQEVLGLVAS